MAAPAVQTAQDALVNIARTHPCFEHPLFDRLCSAQLTKVQAAALLRNYDAHASVLRRLLLKAATLMPESAVGFVLENVRNEYGNGDYAQNHQYQLIDLAHQVGISQAEFNAVRVEQGVRRFIRRATEFYYPRASRLGMCKAAIAAGAITATEVLAIKEFRCMQVAFAKFGREHHIWFNHVTIEEEHSDESLALALHFVETHQALAAVQNGLQGVLDANLDLYDGLLSAIDRAKPTDGPKETISGAFAS